MASAIDVAGDVAAAGGALAGLILVYLGAVSASFASFDRAAQNSVRAAHQRKAWFAFAGLALSLLAVALALFGKLLNAPSVVVTSIVLLMIALAWVVAVALLTVLEIK